MSQGEVYMSQGEMYVSQRKMYMSQRNMYMIVYVPERQSRTVVYMKSSNASSSNVNLRNRVLRADCSALSKATWRYFWQLKIVTIEYLRIPEATSDNGESWPSSTWTSWSNLWRRKIPAVYSGIREATWSNFWPWECTWSYLLGATWLYLDLLLTTENPGMRVLVATWRYLKLPETASDTRKFRQWFTAAYLKLPKEPSDNGQFRLALK